MPFLKASKRLLLPLVYGLANIGYAIWPRHLPRQSQLPVGINFIGYYAAELGLGQALRSAVHAASAVRLPLGVRQLAIKMMSRQEDVSTAPFLSDKAQFSVNCICVNPDMLYRLPVWIKCEEWANRYNVGYWFWELSRFPPAWSYAQHLVDEVWVNTDFVALALTEVKVPVYKIPFAVEFDVCAAHAKREDFGLEKNHFVFCFSFDFHSQIARKNPQAVITAFKNAFAGSQAQVSLVIKTSNGSAHPEQHFILKELIAQDERIVMLDVQLTSEKMRALLSVIDCYVSLHRSEGLGLGMAESMYLGKPVIATAYSGNLEFMNEGNAALVSYELVPVKEGEYPFWRDQVWAEPNVAHAAQFMRKMVDEPNYRTSLGQQAAKYLREHHSYAQMGRAMQARLIAIAEQLPE
jgi:glycosyltransferase involved in cell wall biosynthesis